MTNSTNPVRQGLTNAGDVLLRGRIAIFRRSQGFSEIPGISSREDRVGRPARLMLPVGLLLCGLYLAGCQLTTEANYVNPPFSEQQQAILDVVPFGTARNLAVERLRRAGVVGTFGVSESVFYCDAWKRGDDRDWRLDVALFFDQSGRFYKVAPGQAQTGVAAQAGGALYPAASALHGATTDVTARGSSATEESAGLEWAQGHDADGADRNAAGRSGRRTPFADPDGLR